MDSVGKDQQGRPLIPGRPISPFAVPPAQGRPPPRFPGAVSSGPETSGVPRTAPPSYPGPVAGAQIPTSKFVMPVGYNGPSNSPVPGHLPSSLPQIPAQQFPSTTQVGYPQHAPSSASKNVPLPHVARAQFSSAAGSHSPPAQPMVLPHAPSVPMVPQPVGRNELSQRGYMPQLQAGGNIPPPQPPLSGYTPPSSLSSSYSASNPVSQQSFQQNPAAQSTYSYNSQPGGFPRPPPVVAPNVGFGSREQPHLTPGPPLGSMLQGLVEEFTSLSVNSSPGSVDPGIDFNSLPRPLDSDMEPKKIVDMYPMNCHPRYFRLTTHAVPSSQSLLARWHLPLGATVHPLAEAPDGEEVPVVNFGSAGIIRCRRCRMYVNPYVTFTDAGRKWRCNLCSLLNDVPGEYFSILDASGRRCDLDQRPELTKGSVEFVAPTEYMVRPPMPPLYFFLIDVSVSAVRSGMLEIVAKTIKSCLDELPGYPRTQIGFLTFDSTLHFYNLKSSLTQPQMMVVADLDDTFVPLPDDLLVNLSDSRNVVDAFLDSLLTMFQDNVNVESALGPALKAAFMVMSQLGGKLLVFQATLPSLGIGRLKLRGDDMRIYGTDKEHVLRIPEDPFYKQMAAEFTKFQIGVDIYAFSDKYSDIASLGSLAKYTGGQVYYYPSFISSLHQDQLKNDLARDLTRETAWESVMRIRCGKGVRFTTYHGHFMLRSTDLLALPAVDCDKAFAMQLSLEDTLMTTQTVYFQVALLYTSSSGERRIRVHTVAAPVVTDLSEMYRQADTGAIFSLLSRLAIEKTLTQKLEDARQFVQLRIIKSLKEYRNLYVVQHRLGGRFIFPESLKLLPLYGLALSKSLALRGGYSDALLDERCAAGYTMMILPAKRMLKLLYPSLTKIDDTNLESKSSDDLDLLKSLPLTASSLDPRGLYLYNDSFQFVIWIGRMLSPNVITSILGAKLDGIPDLSKVTLAEHENNVSKNLMKLLGRLREGEHACHKLCHIVRQGEQPRESMLLLNNLIEDQIAGTSGYLEWIVQLYRQTQ